MPCGAAEANPKNKPGGETKSKQKQHLRWLEYGSLRTQCKLDVEKQTIYRQLPIILINQNKLKHFYKKKGALLYA